MIPIFVKEIIGSILRWLLSVVFGGLVVKGVITGEQISQLSIWIGGGVLTLAWALYQKYRGAILRALALELPAKSSESDLIEQRRLLARSGVKPKLLIIPLLIASVVGFNTACGEADRQKLITASGNVYAGLKGASDYVEKLNKSYVQPDPNKPPVQQLSDEAALPIYKSLDRIGQSVKVFKARVKALDEVTVDNKIQLIPFLNAGIGDIELLQQQGVLGIQNEAERKKVKDFLDTARAGLGTVKAFVSLVKTPVKTKDLPLDALPDDLGLKAAPAQ